MYETLLQLPHTLRANKVRELVAVKVLQTSLLNTTLGKLCTDASA